MDRGPTNSSHFDDSITKSQHIAGAGAQQGYIGMHVKGDRGQQSACPLPRFQDRGGGAPLQLKEAKLQIDMLFHVQTQDKCVIQNLSN